MAFLTTLNCSVRGIVAAVPENFELNASAAILPEQERALFIQTTGIEKRRITKKGIFTSDLCLAAAQRLLGACKIPVHEIEGIVFVTQTPDHLIPGNATLLQQRLGISKTCVSIDINSGCSGYVYGLSVASALVQSGLKNVLLLVGDTLSKIISQTDKSTRPIFSDAGSATLLSENSDAKPMYFNLQSDGGGAETILQKFPARGSSENTPETGSEPAKEINFIPEYMEMKGLEVFNFTLREVSGNLQQLMNQQSLSVNSVDYFIFHQANLLLNETIRKKMGIPPEKTPYSLKEFGNTSSATLPVTLAACLGDQLKSRPSILALSGFGAGLSWGSAIIHTETLTCIEVVVV